MLSSKLKKISVGLLSIMFTCNIGTSYAMDNEMMRAPSKNYNKGYYYSHGVSSNVSNNKNWMAFVDSNKNISELSIPGTHDTMANYELTHMVRTQAISLKGQLDSGIRFLDIRCNYSDNQFKINHGPIGLKYNFDDVLTTVSTFLDENPTESVFMRIKQEHSKYSDYEFDKKLKEYESRYSKYFWKNTSHTSNPKLGDVRGKIVVFNDVFGSNVGINYRSTDRQDNYNLDTNWSLYYKWEDIKNHLNKARNGDKNKVYINYLSASGGSFPYFVASGQSSPEMSAPRLATGLVGPAFSNWYPDFPRGPLNDILFEGTNILTTSNVKSNKGRVGIIVSDFPGSGLINSVISRNNFGTNNYISVGGVNYNGDKAVEGLKVNIDYTNNYLYLTNRINEQIHAGFGNNKFFQLRLLDKNKKEKTSIQLNGNDIPSNSKYNNLNLTKFEIGDIIEVYHIEPFRININGKSQEKQKELYEITSNGLKVYDVSTKKPIEEGVYNIIPKVRPSSLFTRNYSGFGVVLSPNEDKYHNANQWEFIYEPSKNAYKIRNVETNKFLADDYYSIIIPNALYAINEPNDDRKYFKIESLGNNEIALINLKTNLAISLESISIFDSINTLKPYTKSNNQKFLLERLK